MAGNRDELTRHLEEIEREIENQENEDYSQLMASDEDLPAMDNQNLVNHEEVMQGFVQSSQEIVDSLAGMYLNDDEQILEHPYILNKKNKDAENFAHLSFLVNSSQNSLQSIMTAIEQGESTPRMYEVLSMLQKEMRENIKLSSTTLSNIENFYKSIREDLGINERMGQNQQDDEGVISDHRMLNERIDEILKNKSAQEHTGN